MKSNNFNLRFYSSSKSVHAEIAPHKPPPPGTILISFNPKRRCKNCHYVKGENGNYTCGLYSVNCINTDSRPSYDAESNYSEVVKVTAKPKVLAEGDK